MFFKKTEKVKRIRNDELEWNLWCAGVSGRRGVRHVIHIFFVPPLGKL